MKEREGKREPSETRAELAHFLRVRREQLTAEEVGITTTRSRRTPGLRREEVAFLADIGVKWYARLEMGDEIHPSPRTLLGIARALRLTRVDTEYIFDLAGITAPREHISSHVDVPEPLTRLAVSLRGIMAAVTDLILTPLRWNAICDAVWRCSSYATPLERNTLVRAFDTDRESLKQYSGSDYEQVLRDAVGVFRRRFIADDSDPFVLQIYERLHASPLFQTLWDTCNVTDWLNRGTVIVRNHPTVGKLTMLPLDLQFPHRSDLVLKLWFPDDDETAQKFEKLETLGSAWGPNDS
jgi:MmyB-like transcription regulator ligand binding domain/Helix-turn-helix domain